MQEVRAGPVQVITDEKGSSALLFCPSCSFFSSILPFFKKTDFLRELLMLRAFYPDILDNDVTTQVHLLLFLWKLKGLMDNGHIFQQYLVYMWGEWLNDQHIKPDCVKDWEHEPFIRRSSICSLSLCCRKFGAVLRHCRLWCGNVQSPSWEGRAKGSRLGQL